MPNRTTQYALKDKPDLIAPLSDDDEDEEEDLLTPSQVDAIVEQLDSGERVKDLMRRFHEQIVQASYEDAQSAGVAVAFDLDNPFVQTTLGKLAKQIKSVADTTRDEVRRLVGLQAEHGWSVEQLASELQQLVETRSRTRALTIARTETGTAYNLGSVAAYRAGGVTFVEVLDGDDDEPCATANGQRWTLEQAEANPLAHPNCVRAFSPIVETE